MPSIEKDHDLTPILPLTPTKYSIPSRANSSLEIPNDDTSTQPESTNTTKRVIEDLAPELLENIMRFLDQVSATVFGLTCHKVYNEYQRQYPKAHPLSLETYVWSLEDVLHPQFQPSMQLYQLLDRWVGGGDATKYIYFRDKNIKFSKSRRSSIGSLDQGGQFLIRSLYGEEASRSNYALRKLLIAWCAYDLIEKEWPWFFADERIAVEQIAAGEIPAEKIPQYPSPFNMTGQGWLDEMQLILAVRHPHPRSLFRTVVSEAISSGRRQYGRGWSAVQAIKKQSIEQKLK
ncbi:hypothetical protein NHQ30_011194 [Ciborinia camelliae]|nr:hypothetical protein NHQ30_011194 [Ciborinia camelliae]